MFTTSTIIRNLRLTIVDATGTGRGALASTRFGLSVARPRPFCPAAVVESLPRASVFGAENPCSSGFGSIGILRCPSPSVAPKRVSENR